MSDGKPFAEQGGSISSISVKILDKRRLDRSSLGRLVTTGTTRRVLLLLDVLWVQNTGAGKLTGRESVKERRKSAGRRVAAIHVLPNSAGGHDYIMITGLSLLKLGVYYAAWNWCRIQSWNF